MEGLLVESVSIYAQRHVRTLPFHRLPRHIDSTLLVISAGVDRSLLQVHCPSGFSFETIPFGEKHCLIAHRGLTFCRPAYGGSAGSGALYWVVHPLVDEGALLLLQYLPPNTRTSVHWHPREHETFHALRGSCVLLTGDARVSERDETYRQLDRQRLAAGNCQGKEHIWVPPYTVHQLVTHREPALNCIVIRNTTAKTLKEINHQYAQWST